MAERKNERKTTLEDVLKAELRIPKGLTPCRVKGFEVIAEVETVGVDAKGEKITGTKQVGVRNGGVVLLTDRALPNAVGRDLAIIEDPHLNCSLNEIRALSAPGGVPVRN